MMVHTWYANYSNGNANGKLDLWLYLSFALSSSLFLSVVTVRLAQQQYLVSEGIGLKEVCVAMEGRATNEVLVHLSSTNDTALCK